MKSENSTLNCKHKKTLFIDVMRMSCDERRVFIEKHSPNMQKWQKEQTLKLN